VRDPYRRVEIVADEVVEEVGRSAVHTAIVARALNNTPRKTYT